MQTIILNRTASSLDLGNESRALRAGYILTRRAIATEATIVAMENDIPKLEAQLYNTTEKKLELIITITGKGTPTQNAYIGVLNCYRIVRKSKHKSKEEILFIAHTDSHARREFVPAINHVLGKLRNYVGLPQLQELSGSGISYYSISFDEQVEAPEAPYEPMSDLLTLCSERKEDFMGGGLFLLPDEFMSTEAFRNTYPVFSAGDPAAADADTIWAAPVLRLPDINRLSVEELRILKSSLQQTAEDYSAAMDELIVRNVKEENPYDAVASMRVLQEVVMPKMKMQESVFWAQPLAAQVFNEGITDAKGCVELWLGEIPVQTLWQFYRDAAIIPDQTWKVLEPLRSEPRYQRRWPVLFLKVNADLTIAYRNDMRSDFVAGPMPGRRKSISIN